ncbi:nucleoside-diphosphate-sugar epimerase [Wenyingzhuangia heitensis]|uniref:Nucleoside-diphosphate-sugar epimerase n=1 Tax=Wenyingzhuangia heitensis TaxID=1487859 RepID=A0ABX0U5W4_9FLAO|nr:NAD(P)H-binding protein [Wenyingzhuangia heitensis]NIJ44235.1 nucleoside-diphosphate-sugar epimerase [Wenyingzhuangia heitensis]
MKILVIGASGRVGKILTEKLLDNQHEVIGTTRQDELLFINKNYTQINLNLTGELKDMQEITPNTLDAVYFVAGSRAQNLLEIDLHGAVKTMQLAKNKNAQQYIMLSSVFSLETDKWKQEGFDQLKDYYIAKHYSDEWLVKNSGLNYTIVQPSALTEKEGTGKIEVNIKHPGENSIQDVASTLLEVLNNKATHHKVITLHSGETPIKKAIQSLLS